MKTKQNRQAVGRGARRRGNVAIITALAMTTLIGFCAFSGDYGLLVWNKNQLQKACDAAALAGAMELPLNPTKAYTTALATAQQNGLGSPVITFPTAKQIRVSAGREVKFFFARALGRNSGNVSAAAMAGRSAPLTGVTRAVPLAITETAYFTYRPGTGLPTAGSSLTVTLARNNMVAFTSADFLPLDLRPDNSGKSGPVFQEDVTFGYNGTIYLNSEVNNGLSASTVSVGPNVVDAMQMRFEEAKAAPYRDFGPKGSSTNIGGTDNFYTYPDYPQDDRRIMTIIVTPEYPSDNSNPRVLAKYFIPVYVEDVGTDKKTKDTWLQLRILPGRSYSSDNPGIVVGNSTTPDTGLSVVQLFQ